MQGQWRRRITSHRQTRLVHRLRCRGAGRGRGEGDNALNADDDICCVIIGRGPAWNSTKPRAGELAVRLHDPGGGTCDQLWSERRRVELATRGAMLGDALRGHQRLRLDHVRRLRQFRSAFGAK